MFGRRLPLHRLYWHQPSLRRAFLHRLFVRRLLRGRLVLYVLFLCQ